MAGRPPLPVGTYGKIMARRFGAGWQARCRYRHTNGRRYTVTRNAKTRAAAERALAEALATWQAPAQAGAVTDGMRLSELAEVWLADMQRAVAAGTRSPGTLDTYRSVLGSCVLPMVGQIRVREVDAPAVDGMLVAIQQASSAARARTARAVLSGMMNLAIRRGAYRGSNPALGVTRLESRAKRRPRALTAPERRAWLDALRANELAQAWDLADLATLMLATGARIGEALAVSWAEVNFEGRQVDIRWRVIRQRGVGLLRAESTKTGEVGERILPLPTWAVAMLRRRRLATGGVEPVFPTVTGTWRDPSNVRRVWRQVRGVAMCSKCDPNGRTIGDPSQRCDHAGAEPTHLVSHHLRKTVATVLDDKGVKTRVVSDQLGHSRVSTTQNDYMGRGPVDRITADALEDLFDATN